MKERIRNIVFMCLSAALLMFSSCSEDMEDVEPIVRTSEIKQFVVSLPQFLVTPVFQEDTTFADTLYSFPTDTSIYMSVVDIVSYVSSVNQYVYKSLEEIERPTDKAQNWISFSEPFSGAYTSPGDSRHKQWDLVSDTTRNDVQWDYYLKISDFVETDHSTRPALELFYNRDFTKGYMVFSPSDFDRIRFPEKRFGGNVKCEMEFTRTSDRIVNKCRLSGLTYKSHASNINYVGNITLVAEQSGTNITTYSGIADFPYIWFDNPEDKGYSLNFVGAADVTTNVAAFYAGLTKNTDESMSMRKLILDNSAGVVLANVYPLWLKNFKDADQRKQTFEAFANPGFFIEHDYKGCGKSSNNNVVDVTSRAQALIDQQSEASPFTNSIYQVEWSKK